MSERTPMPGRFFRESLRAVVDACVAKAEEMPRQSRAAHHLRDAAASLLDAITALEAEDAG